MTAPPFDVDALLASLGVSFTRHAHAPVFTCDEAAHAVPDSAGLQTKNLFLRDKRGRRHLLVVTTCARQVDIARVTDAVDADRLSFGSADRMARYLGVTPGSVTLLALAFPGAKDVELVIDDEIWRAPAIRCHPMINSATIVIDHAGLEKFLAHTGHVPRLISFGS